MQVSGVQEGRAGTRPSSALLGASQSRVQGLRRRRASSGCRMWGHQPRPTTHSVQADAIPAAPGGTPPVVAGGRMDPKP